MSSFNSTIRSAAILLIVLSIIHPVPEAQAQSDSSSELSYETLDTRVFQQEACECVSRHETLTGKWWDKRDSLEERGIEFEAAVTQFYQGTASGGLRQKFFYSGHGDYELGLDLEKLLGIDGLKLDLGVEHRFGQTVNGFTGTGSSIPVAILPNLPEPDNKHLALTRVTFKQELSEQYEVFFGKLDTLEFDTNAFADGKGRDRFFSTAFNYNPIATRTVPFSTLGVGFSVMNEGERFLTLAVLDTEDTATTIGIDELFAEGAVILAEISIPTYFFGRRGNQRFAGTWSIAVYDTLSQEGRVEFPKIGIEPKKGSWSLLWNFDQLLWSDPCDCERGWGLFGRGGISDGNPNPIEWFLSLGIGGDSFLPGRDEDSFGIGWYYVGMSNKFDPVVSSFFANGQGVEIYYRVTVTEHFHISPDLQIVKPNTAGIDTSIIPGLRAQIDF